MDDGILVRKAGSEECDEVSSILTEAANWLKSKGEKLWEPEDLEPLKIQADVDKGLYRLAETNGEIAGCLRYQDSDPEYWDDIPHQDSAFVHRVAVRRRFSGLGLPESMIEWAKQEARSEGKRFLRLDCADRPRLRAVYEKMGFAFHSVKERNPYIVIRYEFDLNKLD